MARFSILTFQMGVLTSEHCCWEKTACEAFEHGRCPTNHFQNFYCHFRGSYSNQVD